MIDTSKDRLRTQNKEEGVMETKSVYREWEQFVKKAKGEKMISMLYNLDKEGKSAF